MTNAIDENGVGIFAKGEFGKYITSLADTGKTPQDIFGTDLAKVNAALASEYGVQHINEAYIEELQDRLATVNQAIDLMQIEPVKAFFTTEPGRVLLFDYNNQYGLGLDGPLMQRLNDQDLYPADYTFTIRDYSAYLENTLYGQKHLDDVMRRLENIADVFETFGATYAAPETDLTVFADLVADVPVPENKPSDIPEQPVESFLLDPIQEQASFIPVPESKPSDIPLPSSDDASFAPIPELKPEDIPLRSPDMAAPKEDWNNVVSFVEGLEAPSLLDQQEDEEKEQAPVSEQPDESSSLFFSSAHAAEPSHINNAAAAQPLASSYVVKATLNSTTSLSSNEEELQQTLTSTEPSWAYSLTEAIQPYAARIAEHYMALPSPARAVLGTTGGFAVQLVMQRFGIPHAAQRLFNSVITSALHYAGDNAGSFGFALTPIVEKTVEALSKLSSEQLNMVLDHLGLGKYDAYLIRNMLKEPSAIQDITGFIEQNLQASSTKRAVFEGGFETQISNNTFVDRCNVNGTQFPFCDDLGFTTPDNIGLNQVTIAKYGQAFSNDQDTLDTLVRFTPLFINSMINATALEPIHANGTNSTAQLIAGCINQFGFLMESQANFSGAFALAFQNEMTRRCTVDTPSPTPETPSSPPIPPTPSGSPWIALAVAIPALVITGAIIACCCCCVRKCCSSDKEQQPQTKKAQPPKPQLHGLPAQPTAPQKAKITYPGQPKYHALPPKPQLAEPQEPGEKTYPPKPGRTPYPEKPTLKKRTLTSLAHSVKLNPVTPR